MTKKVIVAISGASGAIFGITALQMLRKIGIETHLILSAAGEMTIGYETDYKVSAVKTMADFTHNNRDVGALCASGTFLGGRHDYRPMLHEDTRRSGTWYVWQSIIKNRRCNAKRTPTACAYAKGNPLKLVPHSQYGNYNLNGRDNRPPHARHVHHPKNPTRHHNPNHRKNTRNAKTRHRSTRNNTLETVKKSPHYGG